MATSPLRSTRPRASSFDMVQVSRSQNEPERARSQCQRSQPSDRWPARRRRPTKLPPQPRGSAEKVLPTKSIEPKNSAAGLNAAEARGPMSIAGPLSDPGGRQPDCRVPGCQLPPGRTCELAGLNGRNAARRPHIAPIGRVGLSGHWLSMRRVRRAAFIFERSARLPSPPPASLSSEIRSTQAEPSVRWRIPERSAEFA